MKQELSTSEPFEVSQFVTQCQAALEQDSGCNGTGYCKATASVCGSTVKGYRKGYYNYKGSLRDSIYDFVQFHAFSGLWVFIFAIYNAWLSGFPGRDEMMLESLSCLQSMDLWPFGIQ